MGDPIYQVTDRRPIAARRLAVFNIVAERLAAAGVSGNLISVVGAGCGIAAGLVLAATAHAPAPWPRLLWIAGAVLVQLRLLANLLDGMVAVAAGKASAYGELFNDVPDRISDSATLIGLGYAAGGMPILGWLATIAALFTAYVRTLGKSVGGESDFSGPMAKPHRMFVVTLVCICCALTPATLLVWRPVQVALGIIGVGAFVTAARRLVRIARKLRGQS